ncbi:MAG: hypothetical protein ACLFP1_04025 [Candidatus Goldiibacteriota bacterium]
MDLSIKKQINYIRSVLSLSILVIVFYNYNIILENPAAAAVYIGIVAASNVFFLFLKPEKFLNLKMHYLIFITDLSLIILCVHIFTVVKIDFVIAIFLTVFISALASSVKLSIATAVVVNTIYLYIVFLNRAGAENFLESQAILNIPFIFIVALHSSFLAEQAALEVRQKISLEKMNTFLKKEIKGKDKEISAVQKFTEELCDSFAGAVIILNIKGFVKIFNDTAEKTLNIKASRVLEKSLSEIPIGAELKDIILKPVYGDEEIIKDNIMINEERRRIDVTFVKDKEGKKTGILCHLY